MLYSRVGGQMDAELSAHTGAGVNQPLPFTGFMARRTNRRVGKRWWGTQKLTETRAAP